MTRTRTEVLPDRSGKRRSPRWVVHVVAVASAAVAFLADPRQDGARIDALDGFFPTAASVAISLLVAIALFQGALGDAVAHRARRWAGTTTFVYLGAATVAPLVGTIGGLSGFAARCMFAATAGAGAASLVTVLLMGAANISAQKDDSPAARAGQSSMDDVNGEGTPRP